MWRCLHRLGVQNPVFVNSKIGEYSSGGWRVMQLSTGKCPGPFYIPYEACADFQTECQKGHTSPVRLVSYPKQCTVATCLLNHFGTNGVDPAALLTVLPSSSVQLPERLMDCHPRCPGTACLEFSYHCRHGYSKGSVLDVPAPSGCLRNSTASQEAQDTCT